MGVHSAVGGVQTGPYSNILYYYIIIYECLGGKVVLGSPESPQVRIGDYATTDCVDSVFATVPQFLAMKPSASNLTSGLLKSA